VPNVLQRFAAPVVHRRRRAFATTACLILALIGAPQASTLTVTNLDDAGAGSLRNAIGTAVPGDTIVFQAGLSGTITLASSLSVTVPLTIQGAGASISISGNNTVRIMAVSANLTISNLRFTAGKISGPGADARGGAIRQTAGTLTVSDCSFVANTGVNGGAIASESGATLSVDRSSFADNATTGIGGGGIITFTVATVTNSSFTSNSAPSNGGGINVQSSGRLTLINDTFSGNLSSGLGGALVSQGPLSAINTTFSSNQASTGGAAIATNNPNRTIENSVFTDNASSAGTGALLLFVPGGTFSHNVFFNNTSGGVPDDGTGYGTSNFVAATSQPLLPLANYGGPTLTQLPVVGGAAICAGSVPLVPPGTATDQRGPGFPRTRLNGATPCVDAGATQQSTTTTVTSSLNPSVFGQSVTFTATVGSQGEPGTPAGSVIFTIDGVDQTPVTLAGGQASFTPSALSVGGHTVSAAYGGTAGFVDSSGSLAGGQVVTAVPVAATITKAFTPSTVVLNGSSVATLTVTNPNPFPITNVQFSDTMPAGIDLITQTGGTCSTLATGGGMFSINPGTETFSSTSSVLTAGQSCTITVSVRGIALGAHVNTTSPVTSPDAPAGAAASGTLTVTKAATTTALTASANPSAINQPVTFTATVTVVAPGSGTPTGTATFMDGATTLGTGTLNGSGVATFTTSTLSIGSHSITAVYAGDSTFVTSTSSALPQTVNQASTTTTLGSSVNPSTFGQSVTFTAAVTAVAPGSGTPTGTATFMDGATTLGTGPLNGSGIATFTTSTLSMGSHSITAVYGGDTNFVTSTSSALSQTVNQASSSTTLGSSVNPSDFGQAVTFTATVIAVAPGSGTPTGAATFKDGATTLGTGTLNGSGVATFMTTSLSVVTHSITATYGGDTNFVTSTSSALSQPVNQAGSSTTLGSSVNPSVFGQAVTFTATVTAVAPGSGTPTGTATFKDGAATLGSGPLDGSGVATFTTPALSAGTHSITVVYGGDTNFGASTSSALSQGVGQSDQTIAFGPLAGKIVGDPPFGVSATATSGLAVTFASLTPDVCGVSGMSVSLLAVGTCTIAASQDGSANYTAAPQVTRSFTVAANCANVEVGPSQLALGVVGLPYSHSFSLTGGPAPASFTIAGALPAGLIFSNGTISGTPAARGAFPIAVTGTDANACQATVSLSLAVTAERRLVVGAGAGGPATVRAFTMAGPILAADFTAFASPFTDGVSVAQGDVNGDGVADIVTGAGPGGAPRVAVFDAAGGPRLSFLAFEPAFRTGIEVAAGDITGDGVPEILVTGGCAGPFVVRAFSGITGALVREYPITGPVWSCGLHLAAGDVNGDGIADLVIGSGGISAPFVQVVSGASGAVLRDFYAYDLGFTGGVYVAAADVTGDGFADIITGAGPGGGPHVQVFDGATGAAIIGPLAGFMAYDLAFRGGVRVAAGDLNGDGRAEVITATGPGGGPHVRVWDGASAAEIFGVFAFDPAFTGGVFPAAPPATGRMTIDLASGTGGTVRIAGWALREGLGNTAGTDAVHAWAFPVGGGSPIFVGATLDRAARPDVAAALGGEFLRSGFDITGTLAPGTYDLVVYVRNSRTRLFDQARVVRLAVN
jgi:hypothetical protein